MACVINRPRGHRWIQWLHEGQRKVIRLGKVSKSQAEAMKRLVEEIIRCYRLAEPLPVAAREKMERLSPELIKQMEDQGLPVRQERVTVVEFLDRFIENATGSPNTIRNHRQLRNQLVKFFGPEKQLRDLRPSDADAWLAQRDRAKSTLHREIKRAKQFFAAAVRDGLISTNPFSHIPAGKQSNSARQFYIDRSMCERILEACPSQQWRAIFALARFGCLRVPSDLLQVEWEFVNWEQNRFTFWSPKEKRFRCPPLLPDLYEEIEQAFHQAEPGTRHVVTECRNSAVLRLQFLRIVRRAGYSPWERLWHNLRASGITDLYDAGYPAHVISDWVGNTEQVAKEHYLQTTEEHYARASRQADKSSCSSDKKRSTNTSQPVSSDDPQAENCGKN